MPWMPFHEEVYGGPAPEPILSMHNCETESGSESDDDGSVSGGIFKSSYSRPKMKPTKTEGTRDCSLRPSSSMARRSASKLTSGAVPSSAPEPPIQPRPATPYRSGLFSQCRPSDPDAPLVQAKMARVMRIPPTSDAGQETAAPNLQAASRAAGRMQKANHKAGTDKSHTEQDKETDHEADGEEIAAVVPKQVVQRKKPARNLAARNRLPVNYAPRQTRGSVRLEQQQKTKKDDLGRRVNTRVPATTAVAKPRRTAKPRQPPGPRGFGRLAGDLAQQNKDKKMAGAWILVNWAGKSLEMEESQGYIVV